MDGQPIALEGRHERSDFCVDAGDDRGEGDGEKRKRGYKDPNDLLSIFEFENKVDQDDCPGEED
jgi:hypothetical protein